MTFQLKCCGKVDPIGVDLEHVRLSFATDGSCAVSTYTIEITEAISREKVCTLSAEGCTAWVPASVLREKTAYAWTVSALLSDGSSVISQPGSFETGLKTWQGRWIGLHAQPGQVLKFQKQFCLTGKPQKARLYICGLGYFQPKLDGQRLDDSYYIPPVTDYTPRKQLPQSASGHRVTYYTYDITDRLAPGEHALTAEVSDGYYSNCEKAYYEPQPDMSFGQSCLIYELHIEDEAGLLKIVSGPDTLVCATGEVSRLFSGDVLDFAAETRGYEAAQCVAAPKGVMTSPMCQDDRLAQVLQPVASWKTAEGTVYDFGVNHTGGLRFVADAPADTTLQIRFAEVLYADGSLNFETGAWHGTHIQTGQSKHIYQGNQYRLKKGRNVIEPKFSWHCYRYALIPDTAEISELCSLFIYMDIPTDGSFACGEPLLEQINAMFLHTLRCNMHSGVLSDCPHRERLPYTGDGGLVMKSTCYNLDALDFYYKWFQDLLDSQQENGMIPNSAPALGGGGGYAWGNAICTVTRELFALTGDMTVARRGYQAVRKWLGYYAGKQDENHIIWRNSHCWLLGDWLAPEVVASNVYYISTVCYLQAAKTARFLAEILDPAACEQWENLQKAIIAGINQVFFDEKRLTYGNGIQGENMLALAEGIVPECHREQMGKNLEQHYSVETDYHLDTGIVLTPVLINYLTDHGYRQIAWKLMTAKTYPSYFSLMENDTTFSEHWSKKWPDYYVGEIGNSELVKGGGELSHCHPMYGSVAAWLYERVAGLDLTELYKKTVKITPYFMDQLPWAKARKQTAYGPVSVDWQQEAGKCTLQVIIPQGLTGRCDFPAPCAALKDTATGQVVYPDEAGYFRFTLNAGRWTLINMEG